MMGGGEVDVNPVHVIHFPTDSERDESAAPFQGVSRNVRCRYLASRVSCFALVVLLRGWVGDT
jgi:hypothetical protein